MIKTKISGAQAVTLLFLCRMFSLLAAAPLSSFSRERIGGGMASLAALCSLGFQLLVFLPGWMLMKRHPGQNFAEALANELGWAGKGAALLLWLFLTVQAGLSAVEFESFLVAAVYEEIPRLMFALLFLAAALYGSYLGLEAFARYAYFGCTLFLLLLGSLFLGLMPDFRFSELFTELPATLPVFLKISWSFVSGNLEILCLLLLLPHIRGGVGDVPNRQPVGKGLFLCWMGCYTAAAVLLLVLLTGVLGGNWGQARSYPFYTLAMAAEGTLLARMDAVHMSVWSVLGLLRCCLLLYCANMALRCAISIPDGKGCLRFAAEHRQWITVLGALGAVLALHISLVYQAVSVVWRGGAVLVTALWLLPLAGLFAGWIRRAGEGKKHEKV